MLEPNNGAADVVCIVLWGQKFFYDIVFRFYFVGKTCSITILLLSLAHLHLSMVLKVAVNNKIGLFQQKKAQDTKKSLALNE